MLYKYSGCHGNSAALCVLHGAAAQAGVEAFNEKMLASAVPQVVPEVFP